MYDYDRRKVADATPAEPPKSSVRFKWWGDTGLVVSLLVARKLVGKLLLGKVRPQDLERADCQGDIDHLTSRGFTAENVWTVENVTIRDEFKNKGLGKRLYEASFQEVAKKKGPFLALPFSCVGHGTSDAAERVWTSLSRKYPSSGQVLYVRG